MKKLTLVFATLVVVFCSASILFSACPVTGENCNWNYPPLNENTRPEGTAPLHGDNSNCNGSILVPFDLSRVFTKTILAFSWEAGYTSDAGAKISVSLLPSSTT